MNQPISGSAWTESERLSALRSYDILDTPPEPEFDEIVEIASDLCQAPIALVSFIDDRRQWFKAEKGMGVKETPLEVSFCQYAILQSDLFIVPDAANDPCFSGNPLVTGEPGLRFYAGARLTTPEGLPLGTVCVFDHHPRDLTDQQGLTLKALARQAMTLLELRRAQAEREEALAALRLSEERQNVLTRELHHRVRNTLAIVQAILEMTARSASSVSQFTQAVTGRIGSLARTHLLITEVDRQTVSLRDLLCLELKPYDHSTRPRVRLSGPEVELSSEIAVPLGLALHELTTNAAKYGALSSLRGQVVVSWQVALEGGTRRLHLEWVERGGPRAETPKHQGLGLRLLRRVLTAQVQAEVTTTYQPEGARFTVDAPLDPVH